MKKIVVMLGFFSAILFADRGLVPFNPDITIFEPKQRALIAWNGWEEILLLTTDLNASDSTTVIEILPLPSEPKIKKADIETLRRAINLLNRRIYVAQKKNGGRATAAVSAPAAEITFHEKIGAHDISVARLLEKDGFVDWVNSYIKNLGYDKEIILESHKELVKDYIEEGFIWFVFDVITLSRETKTLEPIQYRFRTKKLFYPLKITSLGSGSTTIELLILTPRLLSRFPGLPITRIQLTHEPVSISKDELMSIDDDIYELLKDFGEMKLRIWKIEGMLNSFNRDLIAY
ncbi:MAG: DUF2330 domain-containing protein [candidate division WOR-3 bacterium]